MVTTKKPTAIVLLSGGLDSTTVLAIASETFSCHTLSFNYGQRHEAELIAARNIAKQTGATHQVINLDKGVMTGSALTETTIEVPTTPSDSVPITYVPARNTIFLAHALAVAEVKHSSDIFIGANAVDYSGYPDCRPAYIQAFIDMANLATKAAIEGQKLKIHTPLIEMSKAEIIQAGIQRGVDYAATVSCYQADSAGRACGICDSCRFRRKGFEEAGIEDPTRYQ